MSELRRRWTATRLDEIADVFNGKTPSKAEQRSSGHPVLKIKDLTSFGDFRGHFESYVDRSFASKYRSKWAQKDDTVILNAAHNPSHVASKAALLREDVESSLLTGEWLVVRPGQSVDARFVHYWLTSPQVRAHLKEIVKGIHLYPRDVAALNIPLPPLEEQRRIATILDRAISLKTMRERSLEGSGALGPSLYRSFFLDTPSASWEKTTVEQVADQTKNSMRTGPFGSQLLKEEFTESGVPVLGIDNVVHNEFRWGERRYISEEKYQQLKRYTVLPRDVLITIMGTNGRVAVVPDDIPTAINTKHLCCITLDRSKCLPEFLQATFLWNPEARRYLQSTTKGAIMGGLNMGIIKKIPMELPPLDLQRKFLERLSASKRVRNQLSSHLRELQTLTQSLRSRAFRGDL